MSLSHQVNLKHVYHNLIKMFFCVSVFPWNEVLEKILILRECGNMTRPQRLWPVSADFSIARTDTAFWLKGSFCLESSPLAIQRPKQTVIGYCGHEDMAPATADRWSTALRHPRNSEWRSRKGSHTQGGGKAYVLGHILFFGFVSPCSSSLCQDCAHLISVLQMKTDGFMFVKYLGGLSLFTFCFL